ncbi:PSD1 and planctomycete cytochrome C domain-containing protein [Mariniblastus sp.]|nr:PSD1 and planctomycete cytochrome C domain-containing protein [Mariniblastus sp.]
MLNLSTWLPIVGLICMVLQVDSSGDEIDFDKQIKPILDSRCAECHGVTNREGGLRFTSRDDAMVELDSGGIAIVPGDPIAGSLVARITSRDEAEMMPPEGDRLTREEIAVVVQWIQDGAKWPENSVSKHWSYIAPVRPSLPKVEPLVKLRNEIDYFVAKRLANQGLTHSDIASNAQMLRRVSLALTGIPPEVKVVDDFLMNPSEEKFEQFVDSCLNSTSYGERWATPWFDAARYADSNGYQADQIRESWAYRDWVIRSINRDQPFDQFTVEQLAGDLLPDATEDQRIATGFHRTVTCNVEAGVHPEENRVNQVFDRVNTTGTVFLGTTLECCQCHNHKYDPFSQEEYFRLFSFFNNTPVEVKLTSGVSYDFYGPKMDLSVDEKTRLKQESLTHELNALNQEKKRIGLAARERLEELKSDLAKEVQNKVTWTPLEILNFSTSSGETYRVLDDQSILVGGSLPGTSRYTVEVGNGLPRITAVRIEALTHEELPGTGPGRGDVERPNFILSEFVVSVSSSVKAKFEPIALKGAFADFSQKNWEVGKAIDGDQKTGWAIGQQFFKDHWAAFRLEVPLELSNAKNRIRFLLDQNYGRGRTIGRFRLLATSDDVKTLGISDEIKNILTLKKLSKGQQKKLDEFLRKGQPELIKLQNRIAAVQKKIAALKPPTTLVMQEMDQPRETFKLTRGDYLNPGKKVDFGVPAVLHPWDSELPNNRLGLAKWMVNPANPLLARVAVNRWWASYFGRGLMASGEDFGTQSDPATHPELLDWLAVELMESGWSRKHIHKLIVMSSTFRQTAQSNRDLNARDPENRLLSRGPRFRMPAEMIRDNALAISGLLSRKMGGPPVMPFQPNDIWRTVGRNGPKWNAAKNEDRFRRGVYVIWRRAAPYPSFVNFDAPDRAACVIERPRSNTPLQALTLLNDQAFIEMAVALASTVTRSKGAGELRAQLAYAMQRCVARVPESDEIEVLQELYEAELNRFSGDQIAVDAFLDNYIVDGENEASVLSPPERIHLAALSVVCNVLLNLDETINY